jgi:ferredoxin-nitrite reductase
LKKVEPITCPGLFYATPAKDGLIYRLRTSGGILDRERCRAIVNLSQDWGNGYIQITNRANLQIRGTQERISPQILKHLQTIFLAAENQEVDFLRNIMISPTAGIDKTQLIDTRPLAKELDTYICTHPHLVELPPKFSVGFDGGETTSIINFHNEILFRAFLENSTIYFRLYLYLEKDAAPFDTKISVRVEEVLPVTIALMEAYIEGMHWYRQNIDSSKKSRLRQILAKWGIAPYLDLVNRHLSFSLRDRHLPTPKLAKKINSENKHLDIHTQRQGNFSYMGLVIPLGKLPSEQLENLADLAQVYGNGTLRITPWQNLLIPDIPNSQINLLQAEIEKIGFHYSSNLPSSSIIACTGNNGCASSATDTQTHAISLTKYLDSQIKLERPLTIHFTGCPKSCARYDRSDITLVGTTEGYQVYLDCKETTEKFGQLVYSNVIPTEIPLLIEKILTNSSNQYSQDDPDET